MKEFRVKFKSISENEMIINANNKADALNKVKDLFFLTRLKDLDMKNLTKHYYVVELDTKEVIRKQK